ncbi:SCO1664 family protein [Streptomyces albireticuli]|uniref:Phosphatidylinositol kinase n=1 Tax=Streptomyces albireticuli TaxID=1940 RepID=A0A2A2CZ16_9ACTN|nr:SCO1664 family protein [Streptomyces albireticuli]MCD9143435.1 SCO1664 family protein [Streptomyces albireticuli]MCD9164794.1 SCO1664 family protein [Streptomyces albireticuli]MCD9191552.1 SCO1664 family protein [Streptomyces albireticuli]PAU45458.1 phosphatidylinositol kinase [Streptomyces albireticuli]
MSAPERIPTRSVSPQELLAKGELTVRGQVRGASNAVLYCTVEYDGVSAACVYKPVAGERPLWDFPDGTLARREVAAYELSEAMGWGLVPPTVLRDGPYGEGMCQLWIEASEGAEGTEGTTGAADGMGAGPEGPAEPSGEGPLLALVDGDEPGEGWKAVGFAEVGGPGEERTALLVHADDVRLRRLAVLDAVINNGDRKGGHLLPAADGRIYAIDHGVTFNADDKLRTLLWGWAGEPLTEEALDALRRLSADLADGRPLAARLAELITPAEIHALRARVADLLRTGRHREPSGQWPAIPWPPV